MSNQKKILVIVGCPRSGTSLFADFLVHCGLKTVQDNRANSQYPRGYHEHFPLLMFHKALERYPRGADHRITDLPFIQSAYLEDEFTSSIFAAASVPFQDQNINFIKLPQLALSIDFLFEQFPNLHIIALWRNPSAVFKSLIQKEFPKEMRPASGVKAILLQSVYGIQIKNAYQKYPGSITVLAIDQIIKKDQNLGPLLERLGFEIESPCRLSQSMNTGLWTKRVPLFWALYYQLMRIGVLLGAPFLNPEKRKFVKLGDLSREILKINYESANNNS
ncbi:MAG: sulfotransferase [Anaerolineales bacterium]